MGFKDFITKNFIEVSGNDNDNKEETKQPLNLPNFNPIPNNSANFTPLPPNPISSSIADESASKKFKEHFNQIFKDANLPGPDYYEFKTMIDAMTATGVAEITSFPAAYAALASQGLTLEKLLTSAEHYLKILEADNIAFSKTLETKVSDDVSGKLNEIEKYKKINEEKSELIKKLTLEISENNSKIQMLTSEASQTEEKIKQSQNNYLFAYQTFQLGLQKDIEKIKTYLSK